MFFHVLIQTQYTHTLLSGHRAHHFVILFSSFVSGVVASYCRWLRNFATRRVWKKGVDDNHRVHVQLILKTHSVFKNFLLGELIFLFIYICIILTISRYGFCSRLQFCSIFFSKIIWKLLKINHHGTRVSWSSKYWVYFIKIFFNCLNNRNPFLSLLLFLSFLVLVCKSLTNVQFSCNLFFQI